MDHTNGKTLDDERVQTGSTKVSRVVTPNERGSIIAKNLIGGKADLSISQT